MDSIDGMMGQLSSGGGWIRDRERVLYLSNVHHVHGDEILVGQRDSVRRGEIELGGVTIRRFVNPGR